MGQIKKTIVAVLAIAFSMSFCIPAKAEESLCDHFWYYTGEYQEIDDNYCAPTKTCYWCGETEVDTSDMRQHEWEDTEQYQKIDNNYCAPIVTCHWCGADGGADSNRRPHDWYYEKEAGSDATYHYWIEKCDYCNTTKTMKEKHYYDEWDDDILSYKKKDQKQHYMTYKCYQCGAKVTELEDHYFDEEDFYYESLDNTYDGRFAYCMCGAKKLLKKEKHSWEPDKCIRKATLSKKGKVRYRCECGKSITKSVKWKRKSKYSVSYNPYKWSRVYMTSKTVKVKLKNKPPKGSVVKLIIGNRTYKKKIKNKKQVTFYLKAQPPYGKKYKMKVYYKGKRIGSEWDYAYYGKSIQRGLTKKQVSWLSTSWNCPDSKSSTAGGWSYWWYNNGSYITFYNGKVYDWYNARY